MTFLPFEINHVDSRCARNLSRTCVMSVSVVDDNAEIQIVKHRFLFMLLT